MFAWLKNLIQIYGVCAHEHTTWPRRAKNGKDYVTCLNPYCQKQLLSSIQFGVSIKKPEKQKKIIPLKKKVDGYKIMIDPTFKFILCDHCNCTLAELKINTMLPTALGKLLHTLGGEALLVCLSCGTVVYNPAKLLCNKQPNNKEK